MCVGWVRSQMESVDGAVVSRHRRVLSCTLRPKRLVGLTKCCNYLPINRRIAVVKMTVQGTGVIHLICSFNLLNEWIWYPTRTLQVLCNRGAPLSAWCWA